MSRALPLDVKRAHIASAAALLDVEAKAVAAVQSAVERHPRGPVGIVARQSADAARPLLAKARRAARAVGAKTLEREIDALGPQLTAYGLGSASLAKASVADDSAFIDAAVARYHDRLIEKAVSGDDNAAMIAAGDSVLREDTTRLVASGFSSERDRLLKRTAEEYEGAEWLPAILRMWDSTLDRRTCPRCHVMEGQLRPIGLDFSNGSMPGDVHLWCRCLSVVIFSPIYLGRKKNDHEAA